jgi:hypothetical protein
VASRVSTTSLKVTSDVELWHTYVSWFTVSKEYIVRMATTPTVNLELQYFIQHSAPDALDALVSYLAARADEYIETSKIISDGSGQRTFLRAKHHLSMAQALFSLAERINQEREQVHGNQ